MNAIQVLLSAVAALAVAATGWLQATESQMAGQQEVPGSPARSEPTGSILAIGRHHRTAQITFPALASLRVGAAPVPQIATREKRKARERRFRSNEFSRY